MSPTKSYTIETRTSPCSMGLQLRVVGPRFTGPWVEGGTPTTAWKAYKKARRSSENDRVTVTTIRKAADYVANVLKNGQACPRDTDGDGDCGQPACPVCGLGAAK